MSKTTVVIPNYNGMKYIADCLSSLMRGKDIPEIIVVDNGSTDGSREWIGKMYPSIQVIAFEENKGFSAAVNAGIRATKTEFVFLLNNDTTVQAEAIYALEAAMEQNTQIFSVAGKMINMKCQDKLDGAGDFYNAFGWAFSRGKDKKFDQYEKPNRIFSACAGAALYRRELFQQIGLFDENHFAYLEDLDIGYRANLLGYRNIYEPKAVIYHAGSGVSGSRHNAFKVRLSSRNSIYLIYKNMPILQILLNIPFLFMGYFIKILFFLRKGLAKDYIRGLREGFCLAGSASGKSNKVKFSAKNTGNYFWVQWQLWVNIARRLLS